MMKTLSLSLALRKELFGQFPFAQILGVPITQGIAEKRSRKTVTTLILTAVFALNQWPSRGRR